MAERWGQVIVAPGRRQLDISNSANAGDLAEWERYLRRHGAYTFLPVPGFIRADDDARQLVLLVAHLDTGDGYDGWHLQYECPDPARRKPHRLRYEKWCTEERVIQLEAPAMPFPRTPGAPEVVCSG